ncbi:hypothetical protein EVAR_5144_1 [Eumeta japonica]|uniref:Endonuclease-reverse transcriptase n=1 Tax=Eumeta variegata TaxID=151549 RepID=A0A4C1SV87_EUMVA|nr:hypothetical protein EVAR_5144_1 [Eumeta japonica]
MEEVMAALRKIQNDLDEQKTTITKNADEITEKVTRNINKLLDQKLKTLEKNQEKLDKKIENQEQRLNQLERQARQRNVVFFGIEENERSYSHLENNLIDFLEKYFSLNINCHDLEAARRIGKTDKPRPIAVTFATLGSKIKVMQQKKALNDTGYYLKDDYPYHVLEKRKMLQEQVKIEQEKGNKAIIKYDKLVVLKHNKTDADHTDNRKRYLSISPQHEKIAKKNTSSTSTQAAKKNKTVQSHTTLQRSSSISEGVIKPGMLNFLVNKKDLQSDEEKNKRNNNNK